MSVRAAQLALVRAAILPLARERAARTGTLVLMYHDIGPDAQDDEAWTIVRESDFKRQLAYLRAHFDVVPLGTALRQPGARGPRGRPLAVLTFDDGNAGNVERLLPIVRREAVPVTIYVATAHVQSGHGFWFDRVVNALQHHRPVTIDLSHHGTGIHRINEWRGARNWGAIQRLISALKSLDDRRDDVVEEVIARATSVAPAAHRAVVPLTPAQVRELSECPWVTIGAHTHGHEVLPRVAPALARASVINSRELLARWTGRTIDHFAYPGGDHAPAIVGLIAALGFASAVSTRAALWRPSMSPYLIPRMSVGRYDTIDRFMLNTIGGLPRWLRRSAPHR